MHLIAALRASDGNRIRLASEASETLQRRHNERRSLTLSAVTNFPSVGETQVVVRDISMSGLLMETEPDILSIDDSVELSLPERGVVRARVIWQSGRFFGCQFNKPVSAGAISAALLKSDPGDASEKLISTRDAKAPFRGSGIGFVPQRNFSVALVLSLALWVLIGTAAYLFIL